MAGVAENLNVRVTITLSLPKCCNNTPRNVRNSSNSFALRWRVLSSEVAKLKWFCFDQALKLALNT